MAEDTEKRSEQAQTQDTADHQQVPVEGSDQDQGKLPAEQNGGEPTRARRTFRPRCDIAETEDGLMLIADVPGARSDGLDIQLDRRELTIRAEVKDGRPQDMTPLYREYQVGDYERRFTLTGDFDTDGIKADLSNGVLTLTLPRAAQPQARRIDVQAR